LIDLMNGSGAKESEPINDVIEFLGCYRYKIVKK
jgi:hypothetical protein